MRLTDELDRLVLATACDDFVTFELIVDRLCGIGSPIPGKVDPGVLHRRLLKLIADKLINTYLLHADPPYVTPMQIGSDALPTCWFFITQRGKKCLANANRKGARTRHKNHEPPDQNAYTSAVNF